jgi:hypothetical protein
MEKNPNFNYLESDTIYEGNYYINNKIVVSVYRNT